MGKALWTALGIAAALASANQADATIVRADISAEFFQFSGPAGFFPVDPACIGQACPMAITANGRESVNFYIGGSPWVADFTFDTTLGSLVPTAGGETLTWNSSMGQSPLLSGSMTWAAVGLQRDLSDATSFMVQRIGDVLGFELRGADWHLASPIFVPISGPASLSDPFQKDCFCSGVNYSDATYFPVLGETFTQRLQPVPEPAAWAMLILGFAAVGAGLRRRRARGAALAAGGVVA